MATIFDLSENTAPDGTDRLYITDGTNDEGVQIANLLKGSGAEVPAAKITGTIAHERGGLEADVSAYDGIVQISGGSTSAIKNNWSASAAPTTGDDSGDGYVVGSRWIDTTNDAEYVCVDNTATAAVWTETTGGGGGGNKFITGNFIQGNNAGTGSFVGTTYVYRNWTLANGSSRVFAQFGVPDDFGTLVNAIIYMSSGNTTEAQLRFGASFVAQGELYASGSQGGSVNYSDSSSWFTQSPANELEEVDISSLFTGAAAGDLATLGVQEVSNGAFYVPQVMAYIIEYTPA